MTERSLGSHFKWFVAKVVNRGDGKSGKKDTTESGRVQVRIFGKHDDDKNVPDDKLPWAVPLLPIGGPLVGAGKEGVGTTPIGLKKDTIVVGFYADIEESIPIIFGILTRAGKDAGNDGEEVDGECLDVGGGHGAQIQHIGQHQAFVRIDYRLAFERRFLGAFFDQLFDEVAYGFGLAALGRDPAAQGTQ